MDQRRLREIYREPGNVRLKRIAVGVGLLAVAVLLVCVLLFDRIPLRTMLFIRGCVGVLALVFMALAGVLVYRVHSEYFRRRGGR